jgi:hypothetical protein
MLASLQNRGELNAPDVRRSRATGALSGDHFFGLFFVFSLLTAASSASRSL